MEYNLNKLKENVIIFISIVGTRNNFLRKKFKHRCLCFLGIFDGVWVENRIKEWALGPPENNQKS